LGSEFGWNLKAENYLNDSIYLIKFHSGAGKLRFKPILSGLLIIGLIIFIHDKCAQARMVKC
jgi:hypothetical protein